MRDLARRDPRAATLMRLPESAIQRAWHSTSATTWDWDEEFEERWWQRRAQGQTYEYRYDWQNPSRGVDDNFEGQWLTEAQWGGRVRIPNEAAEPTLPPAAAGGWTPATLAQVLGQYGLGGICNAITAGYLAGLITAGPGGTGVGPANFRQIKRLKTLLDAVAGMAAQYNLPDAGAVSVAFIRWAEGQQLDANWLADFTGQSLKETLGDFRSALRPTHPANRGGALTRLTGAGQSAGRFAFLRRAETAAAFTTAIAAVTPGTNFRGVIVAQMGRGFFSRESTFEPIIGHEIAVSYTAGTGTLVIHDQNSGSITQTVSGAAQIAALLAEHVHLRYVENAPVVNGDAMNRGTFSLRVFT
ncbi:MAG: hypothetical protein KC458_05210 [Dehalococcoidia bacterium]|nr:hypothetical protein [Dehalococcoidia bacterium]MCB9492454.1 hypothetical protein [Dehalococcoidia bacterium]